MFTKTTSIETITLHRSHYSSCQMIGLFPNEVGGIEQALKQKPNRDLPIPEKGWLIRSVYARAKLVNQNYLWNWRGTLSDIVCLHALEKYDRLPLITVLFPHDIESEHFNWFLNRKVKFYCCEPMDVLSFASVPVLSTYCGDIIFETRKDCTPVPEEWLAANDWDAFGSIMAEFARDLAGLGFNSVQACAWWLRLKHTWRFNSRKLLAELCVICDQTNIHNWNQCVDFYDSPNIYDFAVSYAANECSQMDLIQEMPVDLHPVPYCKSWAEGTITLISNTRSGVL